jgi:hypothetical protein
MITPVITFCRNWTSNASFLGGIGLDDSNLKCRNLVECRIYNIEPQWGGFGEVSSWFHKLIMCKFVRMFSRLGGGLVGDLIRWDY